MTPRWRILRAKLQPWFPARGRCALCGWGDAEHRMMDAVTGGLPGATVAEVAANFGLAPEGVRAARRYYPTLRRSRAWRRTTAEPAA